MFFTLPNHIEHDISPEGLALHWLPQDGRTGQPGDTLTLHDLSGRGNAGTIDSATPEWTECGLAYRFDRTNTTTIRTDPATGVSGYPLTMGCWVKGGGEDQTHGIMTLGTNWNNEVELRLSNSWPQPAGEWAASMVTSNSVGPTSADTAAYGDWAHVVGVWESATSRKVYIDGILSATETSSKSAPSAYSKLRIAQQNCYQTTNTNALAGLMLGVRIYDRGLAAGEVAEWYLATKNPPPRPSYVSVPIAVEAPPASEQAVAGYAAGVLNDPAAFASII